MVKIDKEEGLTYKKGLLMIFIASVAALAAINLRLPGLTFGSRVSLFIFIVAAGFWITEVVRPYATALLVIALHIFILGRPGTEVNLGPTGYKVFLTPIASPIMLLFFGGFVLAAAAKKFNLDIRMAKAILRPFGNKPQYVLLGVIVTTALFSMFMSNTATTAMMIAIFGPLFMGKNKTGPFAMAVVLAIPFAANVGGMGTIIGTPPNAIAASYLSDELGIHISFLKWMILGVPIVVVMIFVVWRILLAFFKPQVDSVTMDFGTPRPFTRNMIIVMVTFIITVVLWMTESLHGLGSGIIALFPVVVFKLGGLMDEKDLKNLGWDVLILMAGGLVLGAGMKITGLTDVLVANISDVFSSPVMILGLLVAFSFIMANFMSHTAAANLIVPIVASLSAIDPKFGVVSIALTTSLAQSLPISTPPNAIAYSTGVINTKQMVKFGTLISLIGLVVMFTLFYFLRKFI